MLRLQNWYGSFMPEFRIVGGLSAISGSVAEIPAHATAIPADPAGMTWCGKVLKLENNRCPQ
jgi:hypothetical protein